MEIDLEQPSCDQEKLDVGQNSNADVVDETEEVHVEEETANSPVLSESGEDDHELNADESISGGRDLVDINVASEGSTREPYNGLEFESKEEAYSFYREYARSVGFGITIKASRRSKKSGKFIDIKMACSRFGSKRESATAVNPRSCIKTDCKAGLHIKRKEDGKWVTHSFVKEHNHNIYPDDFLYAMSRKKKEPTTVVCEKKGLQKMVDRFDLKEDEWVRSLYEDRKSWVPTYMEDVFLAGLSTTERAESITSFFDRYICPETTFKEFIELHGKISEDMHDMEANADVESRHKQHRLRSLLGFEKQMSSIYTDAIFKQFQVEALGVASCSLQKNSENEATVIFQVDDSDEHQSSIVSWKEEELRICCSCRSFEYKGFLCRHALLVLHISSVSSIPCHYILKRWTKDAKVRQTVTEIPRRLNLRLQRFHELCKLATKLGEAGSLSPETYHIAFQALEEVLKNCVDVNDAVPGILGSNMSTVLGFVDVEESHCANMGKSSKKKKTYKKRKVQSEPEGVTTRTQDSGLQVEQMNSRADNLDNSYIPQQDMLRGELDSRAQALDGYYTAQHGIQGVGQLNSISPIRESYYTQGMQLHSVPTRVHYGNQQNIQGLLHGHVGYRVPTAHGCFDLEDNLQNMEQSAGSSQYHGIASKHLQDKHLSR
ncbi:hypothetical protein TIFTF001_001592 [Ficus carica]|uniref:Protein FAR1-RELATED SEQUENCE n=1 Tax=Ficus carica TaxID=3494 RepID=A0AA88CQQ2_FICCA|nr:hypothetical protein TIFTF001_001592 [Ficus carica]